MYHRFLILCESFFADGTNLFPVVYNPNDIVYEINKELDDIYAQVKVTNFFLNIDDTDFMLFT